jgi:hypothetical protein
MYVYLLLLRAPYAQVLCVVCCTRYCACASYNQPLAQRRRFAHCNYFVRHGWENNPHQPLSCHTRTPLLFLVAAPAPSYVGSTSSPSPRRGSDPPFVKPHPIVLRHPLHACALITVALTLRRWSSAVGRRNDFPNFASVADEQPLSAFVNDVSSNSTA